MPQGIVRNIWRASIQVDLIWIHQVIETTLWHYNTIQIMINCLPESGSGVMLGSMQDKYFLFFPAISRIGLGDLLVVDWHVVKQVECSMQRLNPRVGGKTLSEDWC